VCKANLAAESKLAVAFSVAAGMNCFISGDASDPAILSSWPAEAG
jgi:hypothetical protein